MNNLADRTICCTAVRRKEFLPHCRSMCDRKRVFDYGGCRKGSMPFANAFGIPYVFKAKATARQTGPAQLPLPVWETIRAAILLGKLKTAFYSPRYKRYPRTRRSSARRPIPRHTVNPGLPLPPDRPALAAAATGKIVNVKGSVPQRPIHEIRVEKYTKLETKSNAHRTGHHLLTRTWW